MTESNDMSRFLGRATVPALVALLAVGLVLAPTAEAEDFRETFEANAVSMGTSFPPIIPTGTRVTLQINITRWSTPEERNALLTQLVENGQRGLTQKLAGQEETGWILNRSRTGGGRAPSERLRYAWQIDKGEGRRRIVAAFDRPISITEASRQPRWRDHDITVLVLEVDKDGNGEGQLAIGVQMAMNPENKELTIESFGTEPVRLMNVRLR